MNTLLAPKHFDILIYLVLWASRLRGFQRRWQQPHLRGPEWFFETPVQPGFYSGPGCALLRRYAWRMAIPCLIDVVTVAGFFLTRRGVWLLVATLVLAPVIHLNHLLNVARSEREALPWAVSEQTQPAPAVGFSLTPRRLRDYSNRTLEILFALGSLLPFLVLLHLYRTGRHNARTIFWTPVVYLYLQLGILLIKHAIVTWRAPVPLIQSAEHVEIRATLRRYYLLTCDLNRAVAVTGIVFWPVLLSLPQRLFLPFRETWGAVWLVLLIAAAIWTEIRRKQLVNLNLKARPVRLPDLSGNRDAARWPLCWQPGIPMLVLKNDWGYSLNLGNTLTFIGMAYLAGMAVLLFVVKR